MEHWKRLLKVERQREREREREREVKEEKRRGNLLISCMRPPFWPTGNQESCATVYTVIPR